MPASKAYQPIDIHSAPRTDVWPANIPPLTATEATRALKRLYRWGVGKTFDNDVKVSTGNRRAVRFAWEYPTRRGVAISHVSQRNAYVNPSQGWRDFVHGLSHWLDIIVNGESKHGKHHARFEAKMIREVISRGWLDGKLKDAEPETNVVPIIDPKIELRQKKLASIEKRIVLWERKQARATRALAKLVKQQRYYVKALG
jgi:hypothetical protein